MKRKITYDGKCFALASHFVDDVPLLSIVERERLTDELAQEIQRCIDELLEDYPQREAARQS